MTIKVSPAVITEQRDNITEYLCCYEGCKYSTEIRDRLIKHYQRKHKESILESNRPDKILTHVISRTTKEYTITGTVGELMRLK